MLNRINVSITSLQRAAGVDYFPSAQEIGISVFIVTLGVWAFKIISNYFPVFEHEIDESENEHTVKIPVSGILAK